MSKKSGKEEVQVEEQQKEEQEEEQEEEQVEDVEEGDSEEDESEYEEIDVTDNPLYQVLSAFFENEEGENVCDHLKDLSNAVRENTKMMYKLLEQFSKRRH